MRALLDRENLFNISLVKQWLNGLGIAVLDSFKWWPSGWLHNIVFVLGRWIKMCVHFQYKTDINRWQKQQQYLFSYEMVSCVNMYWMLDE